MSKLLYRYLNTQPAKADGDRSLTVSFSSETPVLRRDQSGEFYEVLSHDPRHADITRLQNGALLDEHDFEKQPGGIKKAWIDQQARKGRAVVTLAETPLGNERLTLMKSGLRNGISVGYLLTKLISETRHSDGKPIRRFAWKAHEISTTAVGADADVGVGRSITINEKHTRTLNNKNTMQKIDDRSEIIATQKIIGHDHKHLEPQIAELTSRALLTNMGERAYKDALLDLIQKNKKPEQIMPATYGPGQNNFSRDAKSEVSFQRFIQSKDPHAGSRKGCFEDEKSRQLESQFNQLAEGNWFEYSDFRVPQKRDMQVGIFAQGGAFVPTQIITPTIDLPYNQACCLRLGATHLSGLQGNIVVPRQLSASTPQSLGEIDLVAGSDLTMDQMALSPKRISVSVTYSKQFVFQSSPDAESWIRRDMTQMLSLAQDRLILNGQGANNEPLGILNTPGVQSIVFGGAPSFEKIVEMETKLGSANVNVGPRAYLTTPAVRGAWKSAAVSLTGASTVSSRSLWQDGNFGDGTDDGMVNGFRAASTNQVPGNVVIYGNWADLVVASWNGVDVVVDYVTKARNAEIVVTMSIWTDCGLRHPQSFCISSDSGAQ